MTKRGTASTMKLSLRRKFLLGYGIALLLTIVVLFWSYVNLRNLGRAGNAILKENYRSILAADNMMFIISRQDAALLSILTGEREQGTGRFLEGERQFLQWLSRAKDNVTIEGEQEIVDRVEREYAGYMYKFARMNGLSGDATRARSFYRREMAISYSAVYEACLDLRNINQTAMERAAAKARDASVGAIVSMFVIGASVVIAGVGISLVLANLITRPLRSIMNGVKKIAEGDYAVQINGASSDELGMLTREFNSMAGMLKSFHDMNIWQTVAEKQKLESILQNINDGIIIVDPESKVVNINAAAAEMFDTGSEKAQGRHFLEVVRNEELFARVRKGFEAGAAGRVDEEGEVVSLEKRGVRRHYQVSVSPVFTTPDRPAGVILLLRDVTRLKELDLLKSEFVMTASHELKTPLTSIGMGIDLLIERVAETLAEDDRELLKAAHEDIESLKELVDDLLNLSRIETGKIAMSFAPSDIEELFRKVAALMAPQAEKKSVDLTWFAQERLPRVKIDADKITWVLTNMIGNSLRYTPEGGHIRLAASKNGRQVQLSVEDDGSGIPYEYQARIFDKFVRVKDDKNPGSSGLGLAICKEIVRAHGGSIWVDSSPGKGSTFTFTLQSVE
jgi:NtrC-family two-component system sensor histidine kinase KinB